MGEVSYTEFKNEDSPNLKQRLKELEIKLEKVTIENKLLVPELIKKALLDGNRNDASILFKYSDLTKEEFMELQQRYAYYGKFDKQMKEYIKEKDKEKIEKAFISHRDEAAEFIFQNSDLTQNEFDVIRRKWRAK